jgi:hypothetical protein
MATTWKKYLAFGMITVHNETSEIHILNAKRGQIFGRT